MRLIVIAVAAFALAAGPAALADGRPLDVPAGKGWQHAQSGLILTAQLGELQRTKLEDLSQSELDVAATFWAPDKSTYATIYIYRPGLSDPAVWFDRSQLAMAHNGNYSLGVPSGPVTRFATPGSAVQNGLRVTHAMAGKPTGATALAMAPIGEWLVAIRLTSDTRDGAGVDAVMTDVINKIRWPAKAGSAVVPNPVQPCTTPIKFKKAKILKPDLGQSLLGATLSMMANDVAAKEEKEGPPPVFCLEGTGSADYSVYRPVGTNDRYVMALGDGGIAASVFPQLSLDGKKGNYSVTLTDLDSADSYAGFNALPEPAQVFQMLMKMSPVSSTGRGSKNISLSMPGK
jgi:hypothetical protein